MATDENFILRNWDEQKNKFLDNLASLRKKFSKKTVHDIRVNVKKLRAYLGFCEKVTGINRREMLTPLKTYYQYLGKYYDVEMGIYFIRKLTKKDPPSLPFFEDYLVGLRKLTGAAAKKQTGKFDPSVLDSLSECMHVNLGDYSEEDLNEALTKRIQTPLGQIRDCSDNYIDNAHPIRKLFKLTHYWISAPEEQLILDKDQLLLLDTVLEDLGIQQDYYVLEEQLKHFRKEYLVKGSPEHELTKKWQLAVHNLRNQLLKEARKKSEELLKGIK